MGYGWSDQSENSGQKMNVGRQRLRISKIEFRDGDGNAMVSSKGNDPQIKVFFQNKLGQEVGQYYTLSEKAAWTLAKLMGCFDPPANLKKMEEVGVEPGHFAHEEFANNQLLNRELWADVTVEKGSDNKDYTRINPVKPDPANAPSSPPKLDAPPAPAAAEKPPSFDAPPAPPVADAPPKQWTKESAWAAVCSGWAGAISVDPKAKERRDGAWLEGIRKAGKPESQLTSMDWAMVVKGAEIPF